MPSLFLPVKVLVLVGLQLLYLGQSLVVVDFGISGRKCRWQRHAIRTQPWGMTPFEGQATPVQYMAGSTLDTRLIGQTQASSSPTAIAVTTSTDENGEDASCSKSKSSSRASLKELLLELTDRGIAFSPLASRAELEELLSSELQSEARGPGNTVLSEGSTRDSSRVPTSTTTRRQSSQEQPKRQQIQDRIQRRASRSRRSTRREPAGKECIDSPIPSSFSSSSQTTREQHRQRRRDRDTAVGGDGSYGRKRRTKESEVTSYDKRLRRRRRQQRLREQPPSLLDSLSDYKVVDMGVRASRIARKKTGKLWRDLVDSTFDENGYGDYNSDYPYDEDSDDDTGYRKRQSFSGRTSRRERRRSGFNWQQSSRPAWEGRSRRRRGRSRQSSSIDKSGSYFSSEDMDKEESRQPETREQRQEARQKRRQQPYDGNRSQNRTPIAVRSRMETTTAASAFDVRSGAQRAKLPIGQILAALDERNISYSPRASRKELEDLLLNVLGDNDVVAVKKAEEDIQVIEVESISPEDWKKQQEEKLQQKEQQKQSTANAKAAEDANPRAESLTGGTGTATDRGTVYRSINNSYRPSGFSAATAKAYGTGRATKQWRRRPMRPPRTAASSPSTPSTPPSPETSSLFGTPGRDASESAFRASTSRRDRTSSGDQTIETGSVSRSQTSRRIYSPYGERQRSESSRRTRSSRGKNEYVEIKDDIDRFGDAVEDDFGRFGNYLADSVDNIFWGTVHDEEPAYSSSEDNEEGEEDDDSSVRNRSRNRRNGKRHWKDRTEERLDKILGLHKTGRKTYDRWAEKEATETEEDEESGYDVVSYTKGRRRPRQPFWEEDGSIFSVLLGHNWDDSRPPHRSLKSNVDDIWGALRSSHTVTVLLRNLFFVSARIVGSLCKWASVRDTIPRPVVFLGAGGVGLVSVRGARIKNTLLALLSIRVLGEWLSKPSRRHPERRPRRARAPRAQQSGEEEDDDGKEVK